MYAQDNNSLPVWSIFCHQLTNSYLHQFSTIFGGNCIMTLWPRNVLPVPSNLNSLCLVWKGLLPLLPLILSQALVRWVSTCNGTQKRSTTSSIKPRRKELYKWRVPSPDVAKLPDKVKTEGKGKYTKKKISSLVTKCVKLELYEETEEKKEQDKDVAYIMSLVQNAVY